MHFIFEKSHSELTEKTDHCLGVNLNDVDAELGDMFFHPAVVLKKWLDSVDTKYDKKLDDL